MMPHFIYDIYMGVLLYKIDISDLRVVTNGHIYDKRSFTDDVANRLQTVQEYLDSLR